jgi:hypothetical protein
VAATINPFGANSMTENVAYEDAVDLLDADHKAVKKLFIDFNTLCEDNAPADKSSSSPKVSARH